MDKRGNELKNLENIDVKNKFTLMKGEAVEEYIKNHRNEE